MMSIYKILQERGFIKQVVFEDDLKKLLENKKISFYVGFDPTADSLHIGHYIPIMAMMHMQRAGHTPIILLGGGTGLIGDPSGKTDLRNFLDDNTTQNYVDNFKIQMKRFFEFQGKNAAIVLDNAEWLKNLNYINFLREIGMHFSVNKMLAADCYKQRIEKGLTFLEFNYMLMQGYDFLELYRRHKCLLQIGGNDQWSNILAGADLIRRKEQVDAYALTLPLLLKSDGTKMGKSSKGALWLDKNKTSPYEFFQYFRNVEDEKVEECLRLLTFIGLDEIAKLTEHKDQRMNAAKEILAYEVTKLIHGEDEAILALSQAKGAFSDGENMPTIKLDIKQDAFIIDVMVLSKIAASKSEARRLIDGGGVKIDEMKVTDSGHTIQNYTNQSQFILHKGKKVHLKIVL
ncbi:MAG: tyrosine--tRNA ligase [Firmicutes bacterium]|nr:tyrosine--tRNA ligase [Bacillota bacterium]